MSNKEVRLYVVGEGDGMLQSLIEHGLSELGHKCNKTPVKSDYATIIDTLTENEIPVVIKPYNAQ